MTAAADPVTIQPRRPKLNDLGPDVVRQSMKAYRTIPSFILLTLALGIGPAAAQNREKPAELSLGDAITRVQQETNGQVLSAESRRWDRHIEYRIKVLTPEGHVRVMTVRANSGMGNGNGFGNGSGPRPMSPSPRIPTGRHAGGKEKH